MSDLHLDVDRASGNLARQIAAQLRAAVRSGRLSSGVRLPASRELASDLGVSRGVIVEAYQQLVAEGFLAARQGSGTHVARLPTAIDQPASAEPGSPPAVRYDLTVGTPDLSAFPRQEWLAAARRAMDVSPHHALGYPDPGGVAKLRTELAGYLRRVRAADVSPDRLIVVGGVAHGMSLVISALADAGRVRLAVEDPHSVRTVGLLEAAGAELVHVPVDDEGIHIETLRRTGARAVLVTPAHQYPTGVVLSARRRAALVAWADEVDGLILEDDYDAEFRYDRDPVGCLQGLCPQRVALLGSVSKPLAPGLRLGWLAGAGWLTSAARRTRALTDLGSPVIEQLTFAELIASGGYDRHLRRMRRRYRSRRDALTSALAEYLPQATVHGVSAGIQLYVELPPGSDESAVVAAAARRGVAVEGVASMRIAADGPPAVVLGFARMPEHQMPDAVRLLAVAVSDAGAPARPSPPPAGAGMPLAAVPVGDLPPAEEDSHRVTSSLAL